MRKRTHRKLQLHRQTLRHLDAPDLRRAVGGVTDDGRCTEVDSNCPIDTCTCAPGIEGAG